MRLNVALDVPESFRPKADYAIDHLFRCLGIKANPCSVDELKERGGFFYGLNPPEPETLTHPVLAVISTPETWAYFESGKSYPAEDMLWIDTGLFADDMPVLFGADTSEESGQLRTVYTDIIASAFFWLSDWQDYSMEGSDDDGRMFFRHSLQSKVNIANRAVVDEYSALLQEWLRWLNITEKSAHQRSWINSDFALALSFNLNTIKRSRLRTFAKETKQLWSNDTEDSRLRHRFKEWGKTLQRVLTTSDSTKSSIHTLIDYLDRNHIEATFFLKSLVKRHKKDGRDYSNSSFFDSLVESLKKRDHEIGLLSSYQAGMKPGLLEQELAKLVEKISGYKVTSHRTHKNSFSSEVAFRELESNGICNDSSVGWADSAGYRTGSCKPYYVYDIKANCCTDLLEIPVMGMDIQLYRDMNLQTEDAIDVLTDQVETAKKHGGLVVWNFYQDVYNTIHVPEYSKLFERSVAYALANNPHIVTLSKIKRLWTV